VYDALAQKRILANLLFGDLMRYLAISLLLTILLPATLASAAPAADLESRRKALNDLLHEQWEYTMLHNPI
jgi:hypothetical protein